jgi:hypothetical protein
LTKQPGSDDIDSSFIQPRSSNATNALVLSDVPTMVLGNNSSSSSNSSNVQPIFELVQLPQPDSADAERLFRQDLLVVYTPKAAAAVSPVANSTEW